MADVIDDASSVEAKFTEMALTRQRAKTSQKPQRESATHCIECGDSIPQIRREAIPGCLYCVMCQQSKE